MKRKNALALENAGIKSFVCVATCELFLWRDGTE